MLASGGADGTIRLFDLQTEQVLGAPLHGLPKRPLVPRLSPDGGTLFAITDAGRAYRWDVHPSAWLRRAGGIAGRRLTPAEFRDELPGHAYAPAR